MVEEKIGSKGQCPSCRKDVIVRAWVRVKPVSHNPPSQASLSEEAILRSAEFECSHCGHLIRARYHIRLVDFTGKNGVVTQVKPSERTGSKREEVTAEQQILRVCRETGLIASFEQAFDVQTSKNSSPSSGLDNFFMNYLRNIVRAKIDKDLLKELIGDLGGLVECWTAFGIYMILSDGKIRKFIAQKAINLRRDTLPKPVISGIQIPTGRQVWNNVRATKLGDVPESTSLYLAALKDFDGKEARDGNRHRHARKGAVFCRSSVPSAPRLVKRQPSE